MTSFADNRVTSIDDLEALYGVPQEGALRKEIPVISSEYRTLIEHSPFVVLATSGPEGLDCSPRGDPPGFVRVHDNKTVMLPDRRGNKRLDTLKNIVRDPRISLLFLIPGKGETLRINGEAYICTDAELCATFELNNKVPQSVIVVTVNSIYFQCQKAIARSKLWDPASIVDKALLPTAGEMLKPVLDDEFSAEDYDRNYPAHMAKTMY